MESGLAYLLAINDQTIVTNNDIQLLKEAGLDADKKNKKK